MRGKFAVIASTALVVAVALGVAVALLTTTRPGTVRATDDGARPATVATATPTLPEHGDPYFATPEAAMRYLAAAWNRDDKVALWHVTTPDGRTALEEMRSEAVNLRLTKCTKNPAGDYTCVFSHDYPPAMHKHGTGTATFIAGPAREHGWYMTYFEGCG